jgi:hypothetical protein
MSLMSISFQICRIYWKFHSGFEEDCGPSYEQSWQVRATHSFLKMTSQQALKNARFSIKVAGVFSNNLIRIQVSLKYHSQFQTQSKPPHFSVNSFQHEILHRSCLPCNWRPGCSSVTFSKWRWSLRSQWSTYHQLSFGFLCVYLRWPVLT